MHKHAAPHRDEGYINALVLTPTPDMIEDGRLACDVDTCGFFAMAVAFKHERSINIVASCLDRDCNAADLIEQLPFLITESEMQGDVPSKAFWQRATARVHAMKRASQSILGLLEEDIEAPYPALLARSSASRTEFGARTSAPQSGCTSRHHRLRQRCGADPRGVAAPVVEPPRLGRQHRHSCHPILGVLVSAACNLPIESLGTDHVKMVRDEAMKRRSWLEQFASIQEGYRVR